MIVQSNKIVIQIILKVKKIKIKKIKIFLFGSFAAQVRSLFVPDSVLEIV